MVVEPATHPSTVLSSDNAAPKFHLRNAGFSDLPSIARVWHAGFFDDEIIGDIMHPHRQEHPEDVYWFLLRGLRERFWDWRHQLVVVSVEDGKGGETVVGAADWRRLGEGGRTRELWQADPREQTLLWMRRTSDGRLD